MPWANRVGGGCLNGSGSQTLSFSPNVDLNSGETVFLCFVGNSSSGGSYTFITTAGNGTEKYAVGEFVYLNASYTAALTDAEANSGTVVVPPFWSIPS